MPAKPLTDVQKADADRLYKIYQAAKAETGMTQESLADLCGWKTQGAVNQYLLGKIPLNLKALLLFSKALKVSPGEISPTLSNQLQPAGIDIPPDSYPVNKNKLARVPVVGKSMGGLPDRMFTDEGRLANGHDDYAEIYSSDQNAFVTRVDGNSMFPKYAQGEFALVEPNTPPEIEDDVLVKVNTGEVMLKRLVSRRGGIHLASYNEPQSYFFTEDQIVWMYYVAHPVPSKKIKSRT